MTAPTKEVRYAVVDTADGSDVAQALFEFLNDHGQKTLGYPMVYATPAAAIKDEYKFRKEHYGTDDEVEFKIYRIVVEEVPSTT